ncbi:hypothetical protein CKJ65_18710 [Mycobacterium intracellulare]|nr:hypothetical protein CKJ65_18710 [Mycobacterium intracellulare]
MARSPGYRAPAPRVPSLLDQLLDERATMIAAPSHRALYPPFNQHLALKATDIEDCNAVVMWAV